MPYDPAPAYPPVDDEIAIGHDALADEAAELDVGVVALDGPPALDWGAVVEPIVAALRQRGRTVAVVDLRHHVLDRAEVERRTDQGPAHDDPEFARLPTVAMSDVLRLPRDVRDAATDITVCFGPGAALTVHDLLWHVDIPKNLMQQRVAAGAAPNVGFPPGENGSLRRLRFIDWPILDAHKQTCVARWDRYIDARNPAAPRSMHGEGLRRSLRALATGPFRTVPTFAPGAWGGQWLRRVLGIEHEGPNLAWSYELITPESGLRLGSAEGLEVGFETLMAVSGPTVVGEDVFARFGASFPLRFDYLDTLDGDNLSVHCHPRRGYMERVFGWPYTQHETYYLMHVEAGSKVYLGLQDATRLDEFRSAAQRAEEHGEPFDIASFVRQLPARRGDLHLIPAGTPHASGVGNVVLEISATPYLYSLRFYDWLRRDLDGSLRRVHLEHAFANVAEARPPEELSPAPRAHRQGDGFTEEVLGADDELFFAVHRLNVAGAVDDDTAGRFHVLNLVEGRQATIETADRSHPLSYAETIVVPAAAGPYRIRAEDPAGCRIVKAFVR